MSASPVGWIVTNWRLKALSLLLAIGLLGGVSFSENPPTLATVMVHVDYRNRPDDLVITNPKTTVDVQVAGLRSDVQRFSEARTGVTVDLYHARPGVNQGYLAQPRRDLPGLTFPQSTIPLSLNLESLETHPLDIEVRAKNKSAGVAVIQDRTYATCGNAKDHCQVSVTGPASVFSRLKAYVDYDAPITSAATGTSPNQPIQFDLDGKAINLSRGTNTIPQIKWTPEVVTVLVTTQGGTQTKTVPVSAHVQGVQACGYQIAGVDVSPQQVTVSGPVDAVGKLTSVTFETIQLSGLTASQKYVRNVLTGNNAVSSDPQQVAVNVSVVQSFSCAAPTPAASLILPTPTPLPAQTPTPSPSVSPTP